MIEKRYGVNVFLLIILLKWGLFPLGGMIAYGQLGAFKESACPETLTAIVDVLNPITNKIWMDRNLGASQVATKTTDSKAYGDLYQWGRSSDGHQCRNSSTTEFITSNQRNGEFIVRLKAPFDWSVPKNDNLWQGINGVNNPCPSGYRLPSQAELNEERLSWESNDSKGAIRSPLRFTLGGFRNLRSGILYGVGSFGYYWSSTVSDEYAYFSSFHDKGAYVGLLLRAYGFSVRCIKNQ
ncbi:MAG: fibrobacter succinogenes major paralogous domain-containing protein [Flavobacteriales bacterium]|jgi:uncharacterized protein (TIGR02145 family)|nr:fibrobacter succinogenes major paralogous domain-containing protein [Flavobacteriales bacterium]